jgi:hypothetical protein
MNHGKTQQLFAALLIAGVWAAGLGAQGEPWRLDAVGESRRLNPGAITEPYIALHYLTPEDPASVKRVLGEYHQKRLTRAGVRHLYVFRGLAGEVEEFVGGLNLMKIDIYRDAGGELADRIGLKPGARALVIYDATARKVAKVLEAADGIYPMFDRFAQEFDALTANPAIKDYHLPENGRLALKGYDPVAYFERGAAVEGKPMLGSVWRGVEYRFAEHLHRELFNASPGKYLPTYGGWCATAMADGDKVDIDPENWEVEGGRLFLFYDGFFVNAKKKWDRKQSELEPKADAAWKELSGEK